MFNIFKRRSAIPKKEAEKQEKSMARENAYMVCPVCFMPIPIEGFNFLPMQCGHEREAKELPSIFRNEDNKYACANCDPESSGWGYRFDRESGNGNKSIKSHDAQHEVANTIRVNGAIVKEDVRPSEFGRGLHASVGLAVIRIWGFAGKFCADTVRRTTETDPSRGKLLTTWGKLVYEDSKMSNELAEERVKAIEKIDALEKDIRLPLSSCGKYLIVENLETLKQRVAAIEKVLP